MRLIIAIAVAIVLLASCQSAKKLYSKARDRNPVTVAYLCSQDYPCVTVDRDTILFTDTIIDTVTVQCPDTTAYGPDSVIIRVPVTVRVPMPRIRETRTITITKRDSATIFIADQRAVKAERRAHDAEAQVKRRGKLAMWLGIVAAVLLVINIIQFKK